MAANVDAHYFEIGLNVPEISIVVDGIEAKARRKVGLGIAAAQIHLSRDYRLRWCASMITLIST